MDGPRPLTFNLRSTRGYDVVSSLHSSVSSVQCFRRPDGSTDRRRDTHSDRHARTHQLSLQLFASEMTTNVGDRTAAADQNSSKTGNPPNATPTAKTFAATNLSASAGIPRRIVDAKTVSTTNLSEPSTLRYSLLTKPHSTIRSEMSGSMM